MFSPEYRINNMPKTIAQDSDYFALHLLEVNHKANFLDSLTSSMRGVFKKDNGMSIADQVKLDINAYENLGSFDPLNNLAVY